jgi:hypothetical protein
MEVSSFVNGAEMFPGLAISRNLSAESSGGSASRKSNYNFRH